MVEVKLHDIGEGMTEGEIIHYLVKVGDTVKVDQPLVEVQTDKMVAELPSPAAGKVKDIMVDCGKTVSVGTTLIVLMGEEGEERVVEAAPVSQSPSTPVSVKPQAEAPVKGARKAIIAAPYTRKIAREFGVDINEITGTGPVGRITVKDIYDFVKERDQKAAPAVEKENVLQDPTPASNAHQEKEPVAQHDVIPFRGRRKQIAKKMTQSLYTIPHVTHFEEVDLTELLSYRTNLKAMDIHLSAVAFFIKALIVSLKQFPVFNAKLDEDNEVIRLEKEYNIGIATDTEDGLIVPVIHRADQLSIRDLHTALKDLTKRAKEGALTAADLRGGTFTISNVGPLGSVAATPIINHPETALVAFHKTKKMPVVMENDEIAIRSMMNMSMSFDHRVADGGTAVAFTNRFKQLMENPLLWPVELI